ncbi:MAG: hypothetical protein II815_10660, partial [Bacteroidales bacterium]|nr:hypothetical protein [Bacteroidales bacterium]
LMLKSNCCGLSVPIWQEVTIYERPSVATSVTDALCYGGNGSVVVTASDGASPYQFSSDGGSNWTAANNPYTFELPYGNYNIMVKDYNECESDVETVSIAQPDEFNPGAIATAGQTLCYNTGTINEIGNQTSASGGEGVISYQWYVDDTEISGANSATFTPANTYKTTPGTYTFTRKAHYGSCDWVASTGEWVLTIREAFTAGTIASTGETICKDATPTEIGSTTAATGGDGNIHYQWYVGSTAIDGETTATFTPSDYAGTVGTYTFTRKAKDESCNPTLIPSEGSWILTVEEASVGTVTASADPSAICVGKSATLSASATGNSGAMSYVWEGGSTSVTPNVTTTYHVTATATTAGAGCTAETVEEVEVAVATPSVDGIASGDMVWSGKAGTTNWATAGNWLTYSASAYSVAESAPTASTNVFLVTYGECVTNNPELTAEAATNNLNIGSGRALSLGSYTLSIAGDFTNNGTFNANAGTVVFNGSTTQTISGSSLTLNNVTFNNDNNFTLDGLTPTVSGTATFTAGIVTGDMNFGASATTADASRTSHVDGKVTKAAGSSSFTFPTGNAGVLGSVTAIPAAETWVRFHNLVASGDALPADYPRFWNPNDNCDDNETRFDHVSNFEYWDISSPAGLSNATIVASADNASKHFGSTDPAPTAEDVLGAIWTGGCWKNLGGSNQDISDENRTIRVEGVAIPAVTRAGTPYFTLGSKTHETLLPIELVSFTAQCDGRSSLVEWTTATEKNNDYFSLERSDDAISFTEIARVAGAGNSIEPIDYAYTDYGIHGGDNYYRLVQVDYDGTRTVSEIVVANCIEPEVGEPDVQAYPN